MLNISSIASEVITLQLMVYLVPDRNLLRKLMRIHCGLMKINTDSKFGVEFWYTQNASSNPMLATLYSIERGAVQQPSLTAVL